MPEIRQPDVPDAIQQDVLRLEVAVYDVHLMEVFQRQDQLRSVELGARVGELLLLCNVGEQLAPVDEIHDEAEVGGRLEREMQLHDEGMVHDLQHAPLGLCALDQPVLVNRLLDVDDPREVLVLRKLPLELLPLPLLRPQLLLLEVLLREHFHRVDIVRVLLPHLKDLAVGSLPHKVHHLEIRYHNALRPHPQHPLQMRHPLGERRGRRRL
mmetsp:Transcript_64395/g.153611  ORF Transcript_64395/g.153611 Transcript_64395/m.153611 type:complete len:211 (+) Transcript_64395:1818-2450(+)